MKTYKAILFNTEKIGYSKGDGQYKLFFTDPDGALGAKNKIDRFAINSVNGDILFTEGGKAEKVMRDIYGSVEFQKQRNYPLIKFNEII